jgi:mannose-6-phosphate isomerase-like protein (cupin superfamily)
VFTLPGESRAETAEDLGAVAATFGGPQNVTLRADGVLLHRTDSLYVGTVVSGRAYLVLGTGDSLLGPGDSFVLPGAMHTWRNPFQEPAVMACAVFPYDSGAGLSA